MGKELTEEEFRKLAKERGYGEIEFAEIGPGAEGGLLLFTKKFD